MKKLKIKSIYGYEEKLFDKEEEDEEDIEADKQYEDFDKYMEERRKNIKEKNELLNLKKNRNEQPIKKSSTSKEFPEILCEICGKTLPESEKKDHMYCHNLERQQNEQNELLNNIGNFGVSQREIEQQKKIEKMIKENNERRRIQSQQQNQRISQQNQRPSQQNQGHNQHNSRQNQQNNRQNQHQHQHQQNQRQNIQNQVNQRINNNRINNLIDSDDNILTDSDIQLFNQLGIHGVSNANSRPNNTSNQNQPHIRITRARTGPNGVTIFEQFGNDQSNIQRIMNNNNMMFPSMMTGNRNSSNRMFIPISNLNNINSLFEQIFSRARHHEHPTSQQILDALPETQIDDASKLDSEKKNCVICLEDFKNGDRATILPCIHLFHTNCIKNWLKTQDCCPICKYKLNGQNLNSNH